jgi:hypothetical protein
MMNTALELQGVPELAVDVDGECVYDYGRLALQLMYGKGDRRYGNFFTLVKNYINMRTDQNGPPFFWHLGDSDTQMMRIALGVLSTHAVRPGPGSAALYYLPILMYELRTTRFYGTTLSDADWEARVSYPFGAAFLNTAWPMCGDSFVVWRLSSPVVCILKSQENEPGAMRLARPSSNTNDFAIGFRQVVQALYQ